MGSVIPPKNNAERMTQGGLICQTIYSGIPQDQMIYSGAGRLDAVYPMLSQSGVATVIYDGAVATSGGPFALSGHRVLCVLPANLHTPFLNTFPSVLPVGAPFYSGLIVASKSGQIGYTLNYSPLN